MYRFQSELAKLDADGDLDCLPKSEVATPFMAKQIKFLDVYDNKDPKWTCDSESYLKNKMMYKLKLSKQRKNRVVYDYLAHSPFYKNTEYIEKMLKINYAVNESVSKDKGHKKNSKSLISIDKSGFYTSLNPYYVVQGEKDNTLVFESRFESGNLKKAIQIDEFEYDLIIRKDYKSQGPSQWYYFSICNVKSGNKYVFNLRNFSKPDSLYNQGMKPLVYSTKKAESEGIGWYRGGEDI